MVPESGFVIDLDGLESDYDLQQMVGREEPEGKEGVGIEGSEVVRMEGRKGTEGTEGTRCGKYQGCGPEGAL